MRSYVADGGLSGAIARLAEDLFSSLSPDEQAAARVVLLRLAGPGEGEGVVRRRAPLSELVALPSAGRGRRVSRSWPRRGSSRSPRGTPRSRTRRCSANGRDCAAGSTTTPPARDLLRRLTADAAEWDAHDRDDASLWRGTRLLAGAEVALARSDEVTAREREFLAAAQ